MKLQFTTLNASLQNEQIGIIIFSKPCQCFQHINESDTNTWEQYPIQNVRFSTIQSFVLG